MSQQLGVGVERQGKANKSTAPSYIQIHAFDEQKLCIQRDHLTTWYETQLFFVLGNCPMYNFHIHTDNQTTSTLWHASPTDCTLWVFSGHLILLGYTLV